MTSLLPNILYGTAWKEDRTRELVQLAIEQGFRGIDTANQRKHYHEAGVGEAIQDAIEKDLVTREDLFLQTKFTFRDGQDHRLPYDPTASIAEQVEQSFASSLVHLGVETIDSFVLHGPSQSRGLGANDWDAWKAMEVIQKSGRTRFLGISNCSLEQLTTLVKHCEIKPRFVQNRCYAVHAWDRGVREFCRSNDIVYQGFSLLTANAKVLTNPQVVQLARKYHCHVAQIIFSFAIGIGMLPLTGTTNPQHMLMDLELDHLQLDPIELAMIEIVNAANS